MLVTLLNLFKVLLVHVCKTWLHSSWGADTCTYYIFTLSSSPSLSPPSVSCSPSGLPKICSLISFPLSSSALWITHTLALSCKINHATLDKMRMQIPGKDKYLQWMNPAIHGPNQVGFDVFKHRIYQENELAVKLLCVS